jgi:hypothetical protein
VEEERRWNVTGDKEMQGVTFHLLLNHDVCLTT